MRGLSLARLIYGTSLLLAPGAAVRLASGGQAPGGPTVARVLGCRHVAQALTLDRTGSGRWRLLGAGIDLLHALNMVGVAVLSHEHRRAAMIDAVLAFGMTVCGLRRAGDGQ